MRSFRILAGFRLQEGPGEEGVGGRKVTSYLYDAETKLSRMR